MTDLSGVSDADLVRMYQSASGAQPAAPADNITRLTVRPPGARDLSAMSDADLQKAYAAAKAQPGMAMDAAQSFGSGIVKGASSLAGLPGDIGNMFNQGADAALGWISNKLGIDPAIIEETKQAIAKGREHSAMGGLPTGQQVRKGVEDNVTGPLYEPQTIAGHYAGTVGEFLPGAAMGPGGAVRNAINFGVVPGLVSEAAGQATKGGAAEPYVRGGVALATGGAASLVNRPSGAGRTLAQSAQGATEQQLAQAEQLFQEAQQMGLPITRFEAVQHVTQGATGLGDLQRVVEGSGQLKPFFSQRPGQVEQAGRQAIDTVAPPTASPSGIGPAVGEAAEGAVNDVRGAINRAAEPFYTRASTVRLTPQEMAQTRALPGFDEAMRAVRGDPQLNRHVANLPADSVGFLNEVKKYLDQQARNANRPLAQNPNMQRAAGYGQDATAARNIGTHASVDYASALAVEGHARERFLEPLLRGPLGKLAERDITTQKAIAALFPENPLPGGAQEIETAVRALAQRNPTAARQLVAAHIESVFNDTTRALQSGPNQFGGAKFAATLRGGPQVAQNVEAAVRALPGGDQVWAGFDRLLTVLEAQGTRQRIGSQTAFNQEMQSELKRGGVVGDSAMLALGAGMKIPQKAKDAFERWRLGRGVDELARLATDPNAAAAFRQLASAPVGSREAHIALVRLAVQTKQAAAHETPKPEKARNN